MVFLEQGLRMPGSSQDNPLIFGSKAAGYIIGKGRHDKDAPTPVVVNIAAETQRLKTERHKQMARNVKGFLTGAAGVAVSAMSAEQLTQFARKFGHFLRIQ